MRHLRQFLIAAFIAGGLLAASAREKTSDGSKGYLGAIVTDAESGQVLFEDNADVVHPPASMTKLMTFAVLHAKLASGALTLQTPVKITPEDAKMGGTQVYLDPRETFPVEELIYAMMIQSANDAAHALARAGAGSVEAFVELMNAKARELGMTHTTFRSPHGLPPPSRRIADGDLTTPRDYAILCRYLLIETDILKYTSVRERDFGASRANGPQHMRNHNNLLGRVAGVDGLKTGYTAGAGYCLSATAERNGRRVIAVVMGSFGPHGETDKGRTRDLRTIELIERGFASLPPATTVATVKTTAAAGSQKPHPATAPDKAVPTTEEIPTVKVNQAAAAPAQSSTTSDLSLTFQVPASK